MVNVLDSYHCRADNRVNFGFPTFLLSVVYDSETRVLLLPYVLTRGRYILQDYEAFHKGASADKSTDTEE